MVQVFLLLGSNLGDRLKNLEVALNFLEQDAGRILSRSSVYKTSAWGNTEQPDFYNQVIEIGTALDPHELLRIMLTIEKKMGRQRVMRWGERIIDIDLLLFGETVLETENLIVPHAQLPFRRFTLVPLAEIAGSIGHPVLHKTIDELLKDCPDALSVEKI